MKFSLWSSDRSWQSVVETAQFAERTGWHALWFADHFMPQSPDDSANEGPILECWSVLAGIAAVVPRIRLTSMVSPVTIHHPVVLAKRATTVDQISGGRVVLGIGAGWQVNEHAAYGFPLPPAGQRVARFAEAIEVIHHLLNEPTSTVEGQFYRVTDAPFEPKPVQQRLPILVGTGSPRMMRLTARWADEWNTWGNPTQLAERTALFRQACDVQGRDPDSVRRSAQALIFLTDSDAERDRVRAVAPADRSLVGSASELIDLLGQYVELGIDEFGVPDFTLGTSSEQKLHAYERILSEVLGAF